jgi:hypothetical protein
MFQNVPHLDDADVGDALVPVPHDGGVAVGEELGSARAQVGEDLLDLLRVAPGRRAEADDAQRRAGRAMQLAQRGDHGRVANRAVALVHNHAHHTLRRAEPLGHVIVQHLRAPHRHAAHAMHAAHAQSAPPAESTQCACRRRSPCAALAEARRHTSVHTRGCMRLLAASGWMTGGVRARG